MEQCFNVADFWTTTLLKVTLLHGRFSYFLNCTNDIKSRKASQIIFHYHLEKINHMKIDHINHQKQQPDVFYKIRCSKKFLKIHRKTLCQSLFF